jgi:predicted metal-binding transcription factor (methanogenesis marker protein 9)
VDATVTAKRRYCEIRKPTWVRLVDKIIAREALTDKEYNNWQQLEREMLNVVNYKASLISGKAQENRKRARFIFLGCVFIVKINGSVGKIINVERES